MVESSGAGQGEAIKLLALEWIEPLREQFIDYKMP